MSNIFQLPETWLFLFLGIIVIHAFIYGALTEIGWRPTEPTAVPIVEFPHRYTTRQRYHIIPETQFEKFRTLAISKGCPFDGIVMDNNIYLAKTYNPSKSFFKENEVSSEIWLDRSSGYVVVETDNSIYLLNEVIKRY